MKRWVVKVSDYADAYNEMGEKRAERIIRSKIDG